MKRLSRQKVTRIAVLKAEVSVENIEIGKPELVIGVIAKLGTDIDLIIEKLILGLQDFRYESHVVRVTEALKEEDFQRFAKTKVNSESFSERVATSMTACNELRSVLGNDVMAKAAIGQIKTKRDLLKGDPKTKNIPRAFIVRQLKRPEEAQLFRDVYGENFVLVSNYCPVSIRKTSLADQIAKSKNSLASADFFEEAERLIKRDEDEKGNNAGQSVRAVFPMADVILNAKSVVGIEKTVRHFLNAFFLSPRVSPTRDEYGAYMANSASMRSLDLSRQVGAAIFNEYSEIIALGCNEVPKFGGGTYLEDSVIESSSDGRDVALGRDANAKIKHAMVRDAVSRISKVLGVGRTNQEIEDLVEEGLHGELEFKSEGKTITESRPLKNLLMMDIGEFGRSVHAEMNAITDAARNNHITRGATLYSTTFPCHNCSKHIVAAGIIRVVYIQPYPKSKADELYPDSIAINPKDPVVDKVVFEVHVGIAPNLFARVFKNSEKRKDARGNIIKWSPKLALPAVDARDVFYLQREEEALKQLKDSLDEINSKTKKTGTTKE